MENLDWLIQGFSIALTFENILVAILGSILGIILGAMPGIGALAGVALLLPVTFQFNPTTGIIMLAAIYYSNMFGGAFSAILLNIPGTASAVMTAMDGNPMAEKGRPGQALLIANISSFIGGLIGMIILVFSATWLAEMGLHFGPAEMAGLMLIAMTSISWLVGENPSKGLTVTLLGMLTATIGMDLFTGSPRYTFGSLYLLGGIEFICIPIGLVGFSQIIDAMVGRHNPSSIKQDRLTFKGSLLTKNEVKRLLPPAIRSGFLGTIIGILPGAGATASSFLNYGLQKMFKNEVPLGEGAVEGIASVEAANNSAAAGAFAPLLALGIPGSGTTAVLLGGLMMWGLNPGPLLFETNPEFTWGLIASLFLANIITLILSFLAIPWIIKILKIPVNLMIPCIAIICIVGSYSTTNSMYGVIIMVTAGFVGYILKRYKYPLAPFILAMVLSPTLEINLRRALTISGGSVSIFFESIISTIFISIFILIISMPLIRALIKIARKKSA